MENQQLHQLKSNLVKAADRLTSSNLLSATKHGNMSLRLPSDKNKILLTGAPTLAIGSDDIALVDLEGSFIEGRMTPVVQEIIGMHTVVYRNRDDVNCVIHTHSPHSTAFAIASKKIEPVYEGLIRWGITKPIPVAEYGPRGSEVSIDNIKKVLGDNKACLLENHGLLAFGEDIGTTLSVIYAMEEASQMSILASMIGHPKLIPENLIAMTISRAKEFEKKETLASHH